MTISVLVPPSSVIPAKAGIQACHCEPVSDGRGNLIHAYTLLPCVIARRLKADVAISSTHLPIYPSTHSPVLNICDFVYSYLFSISILVFRAFLHTHPSTIYRETRKCHQTSKSEQTERTQRNPPAPKPPKQDPVIPAKAGIQDFIASEAKQSLQSTSTGRINHVYRRTNSCKS